jgi:hypothetical protein
MEKLHMGCSGGNNLPGTGVCVWCVCVCVCGVCVCVCVCVRARARACVNWSLGYANPLKCPGAALNSM